MFKIEMTFTNSMTAGRTSGRRLAFIIIIGGREDRRPFATTAALLLPPRTGVCYAW